MTETEARQYAHEVWEQRLTTYHVNALLMIVSDTHYWIDGKAVEWFHAEKRGIAREILRRRGVLP